VKGRAEAVKWVGLWHGIEVITAAHHPAVVVLQGVGVASRK